MKPGDRVVILPPVRKTERCRGTILSRDGAYIIVRPDDSKCEEDVNELYPNELELLSD